MNVIELEQPEGVHRLAGGQTAINLAEPLMKRGVRIIGTDFEAIEKAENRDAFEKVMQSLGIPQPRGEAVTDIEEGVRVAAEIGYPVLVRPSYVLGGRAMQIVSGEEMLRAYLKNAVEINEKQPVLVDKYIVGRELEVDAVCDGREVFVPGIMELVERTGIHSGDSISVYPTFSVSDRAKETILEYTRRLGLAIGIVGLTTYSSSSTRRRTFTSSRSTPAPRARCRSSPRPAAGSLPTSPRAASSERASRSRASPASIRRKRSAGT